MNMFCAASALRRGYHQLSRKTFASPLSEFRTSELTDALVKLGFRNGGVIPDLKMISPKPGTAQASALQLCGPAYTVRMVLASDESAPRLEGHVVDHLPKDTIAVVSGPQGTQNAVWGGLMSIGGLARGCLGAIVHGRVRDVQQQQEVPEFPVFALGTSTMGQSPHTRPSEVQVPVILNADGAAAGGIPHVEVVPGDIIVADEDGVVCVPIALEGKVVELAKRVRAIEDQWLEDIRNGVKFAVGSRRFAELRP